MKYTAEVQVDSNSYIMTVTTDGINRQVTVQKTTVNKNRSTMQNIELDHQAVEVLKKLLEAI